MCFDCVLCDSLACWLHSLSIADSNMTSLLYTHGFHMLFLHMEVLHTNHAGAIIFEALEFDEKLEFIKLVQHKMMSEHNGCSVSKSSIKSLHQTPKYKHVENHRINYINTLQFLTPPLTHILMWSSCHPKNKYQLQMWINVSKKM